MGNFSTIRNGLLGLIAALLILVQGLFVADASYSYFESQKTEVRKEITSKANYVEVVTRTTVPSFLFYWIAKTIAIDIPNIDYHNCIALFVNPHSFNVFYTFTSALAP